MLFKKSKQVSLEKVIRTIDDYREAQNQLAHLKHEAKVVVTYMRQPKTNPLNDKIVMMTDDKMINSGYMLDLAKQVEVLADKCWAYEQDRRD